MCHYINHMNNYHNLMQETIDNKLTNIPYQANAASFQADITQRSRNQIPLSKGDQGGCKKLAKKRKISLCNTIIPLVAVGICLFTRLLYFGKYIDEWDSVNFAFGLSKGYDILHDQPHFPGYPVYMFVSWIWYMILGSDIQSLIFSGILFSSLAVYPLYELVKRMFSQEVAILAAVLYIVNPQIWLQAEKPLSDAFGLFFVITAILFFYLAIECDQETSLRMGEWQFAPGEPRTSLMYLGIGGVILGLGLGVRVTYLALIPIMAYTAFRLSKKTCGRMVLLWGASGFALGVTAWLGYLIVRFQPYKFYKKFLSHADYHFYREGNSIITTDDYGERFFDIFHNLSAHCLGTWWTDTPILRIVPTLIIGVSLICFFMHERWNLRNKFLMAFFVPYFLWVALIQDAIRQVMVLIPFLVILVSAGLWYVYIRYLKGGKSGVALFLAIVFAFVISQTVDSLRIVSINRNEEPPSVSTINYITKNYNKDDTKFYCLNDWRLFQYYAPEWCDKKNSHVYFTSRMNGVLNDLGRLKNKPKHILVSSKLFERDKHKDRLKKLVEFKRNRYGVADYNWLALYRFEWR
ncbi:MAG: glycosyltransferase family 39 protein [Candidatus Brocadia sp.]|nr:glycosyltransferase family 39 protein [Candidatus Brocadia sp.]